ncbi:MAG: hypothetical protein IJ572_01675 [Bacilli bacterium]|nr:hypothetical protein [Bacilli bacterium]
MKKMNLLIIGIVALFGFAINVKAANGVNLSCEKSTIQIGESTTCTVSITSDATINATAITLSTSEYLDVSGIIANTAAGWTASATGTSAANGLYAFNSTTGSVGLSEVFSFNVTLNQSASNLSEGDSCGQLCISAATFDGTALQGIIEGTGTCFAPVIVVPTCQGSECDPKTPNPETGDFMNYVIIIGTAVIAIVAVVIARRSSKFYRV